MNILVTYIETWLAKFYNPLLQETFINLTKINNICNNIKTIYTNHL
jgi:hypothetical protein